MAVKRPSDNGQKLQLTYQTPVQQQNAQQQSQTHNQSPMQQSAAVTENFTMTGYSEDGGYFSPSLQDDVFQQVTAMPDGVLLHTAQLDTIQVCISFLFRKFKLQSHNQNHPTNFVLSSRSPLLHLLSKILLPKIKHNFELLIQTPYLIE